MSLVHQKKQQETAEVARILHKEKMAGKRADRATATASRYLVGRGKTYR